jgi:hypothetical protein
VSLRFFFRERVGREIGKLILKLENYKTALKILKLDISVGKNGHYKP